MYGSMSNGSRKHCPYLNEEMLRYKKCDLFAPDDIAYLLLEISFCPMAFQITTEREMI